MLAACNTKNANYLRIVLALRAIRDSGVISEKADRKAKKYYRNITGADIVIVD